MNHVAESTGAFKPGQKAPPIPSMPEKKTKAEQRAARRKKVTELAKRRVGHPQEDVEQVAADAFNVPKDPPTVMRHPEMVDDSHHNEDGSTTHTFVVKSRYVSADGRTSVAVSGMDKMDPLNIRTLISLECKHLEHMLHDKNRLYGSSAFKPARIMSKASPVEQILVRIDDKLSRLAVMDPAETEDVVQDLLGYLILLRVAKRLADAP